MHTSLCSQEPQSTLAETTLQYLYDKFSIQLSFEPTFHKREFLWIILPYNGIVDLAYLPYDYYHNVLANSLLRATQCIMYWPPVYYKISQQLYIQIRLYKHYKQQILATAVYMNWIHSTVNYRPPTQLINVTMHYALPTRV